MVQQESEGFTIKYTFKLIDNINSITKERRYYMYRDYYDETYEYTYQYSHKDLIDLVIEDIIDVTHYIDGVIRIYNHLINTSIKSLTKHIRQDKERCSCSYRDK